MTARAAIVDRILDRVQFLIGPAPNEIAHDRPLLGQARIDSLDVVEISMAVEEEFGITLDNPNDSWSIESIAEMVEKTGGR
jgi:acyl carrier protein